MTTHATVYQAAAHLIVHQLRSAFSDEGERQARVILAEFTSCFSATGSCPPQAVVPLLVAGLELTDLRERERCLEYLTSLPSSVMYAGLGRLKACMRHVWQRRDAGMEAVGLISWIKLQISIFHPSSRMLCQEFVGERHDTRTYMGS
jgi:hypothetical protein